MIDKTCQKELFTTIFASTHKVFTLSAKLWKMRNLFTIIFSLVLVSADAQSLEKKVSLVKVDSAWANNSVNAVVFRKNSLVTFRDKQFIAFYDEEGRVILGKRQLGEDDWQLHQTQYKGRTTDAHNSISIMVDGAGYLHLAWDHHNNPLNYCRTKSLQSLELTDKMPMTGQLEDRVTYPEFYRLPDGNLLFFYRDGQSGRGNLLINHYDAKTRTWTKRQSNLIDGEGERNAYWQAYVDANGVVHLSWVWRESGDVSTNHDLAYARSKDGGKTWEKSDGEGYKLPITAATAEYACEIPEKSELINQTSMYADEQGRPYIATYWKAPLDSVPRYHLVYQIDSTWTVQKLGFRQTSFTLSGGGTKRIPISRPQVVGWQKGRKQRVALLFRDEERGNKVSVAINRNLDKNKWKVYDLWRGDVAAWEPTYDTELWKEQGILHLFVQHVEQVDGEGLADGEPQLVWVLEWEPK